MGQSKSTEVFVIERCIASYPHLFQPRQPNPQSEAKFSVKLYVPGDQASIVNQKMQEIAQTFTGGETQNPNFRWPIAPVTGADAQNPRLHGHYVMNVNASADYPPAVVGPDRQPIVDRGQIYAGMICAVGVRLYTYNNMGNVGVGAGFNAVMKTADGEHFVEGTDPNALFANVQAQPAQPGGQMPGGAPLPATPQQPMNPAAPQGQPAPQGVPQPTGQVPQQDNNQVPPMPTAPFPGQG